MTAATATEVNRPLDINQSKDFPVAGTDKTVAVTRTGLDAYRIVVLDGRGLSIPAYTVTMDSAAGNLPVGMSGRRAAWEYMRQRIAELSAATERPADLLARTAADYATADAKRLSDAQQAALRNHSNGHITHSRGVTVATLRALHRAHLGRLVYQTTGMRRILVGVDLNQQGRRLADHLINHIAA